MKYTYKTTNIKVDESENLLYEIYMECRHQGELCWQLVQVLGNDSNQRDYPTTHNLLR
jgi:hypothetical protein